MRHKFIYFLCFVSVFGPSVLLSKKGEHIGEQKMIDVNIEFLNPAGTTVTNSEGVYYNFWGYTFYENKVYPQEYWNTYPLYFFGEQVGVKVTVTNKGPRAKTKVRIVTEAYVLRTDGSNGVTLTLPKIIDVELNRDETKVIDASFICEYTEGADSGLDRFIVKVKHINEGGGPGNPEPALIMVKEGVFCPPKYLKK